MAVAAGNAVVAAAAEHGVIAGTAVEQIIAVAAIEAVVAVATPQDVGIAVPGDGVIAGKAVDQVLARAAFETVGARRRICPRQERSKSVLGHAVGAEDAPVRSERNIGRRQPLPGLVEGLEREEGDVFHRRAVGELREEQRLHLRVGLIGIAARGRPADLADDEFFVRIHRLHGPVLGDHVVDRLGDGQAVLVNRDVHQKEVGGLAQVLPFVRAQVQKDVGALGGGQHRVGRRIGPNEADLVDDVLGRQPLVGPFAADHRERDVGMAFVQHLDQGVALRMVGGGEIGAGGHV